MASLHMKNLIGQSAMGYCAGKPTEKSRVSRRIRKAGEWLRITSSRVLPTSHVVYQLITHKNLLSIA